MHRVVTETELDQLAAEISQTLPRGANLYLSGELGAGKTTFTRALLKQLGSLTSATSPTFSLLNYHTTADDHKIIHADLYRLTTADDVFSLNLLEALDDPGTTVIVEWPEKGHPILPAPSRHLHFSHHTPDTRVISDL
jgi:tRNA threonylcarbamoyladenosine biosynthesis protein TsaE